MPSLRHTHDTEVRYLGESGILIMHAVGIQMMKGAPSDLRGGLHFRRRPNVVDVEDDRRWNMRAVLPARAADTGSIRAVLFVTVICCCAMVMFVIVVIVLLLCVPSCYSI